MDAKFGTGCVKVTPAHDPADYEMALRHQLPLTVVIAPDGTMTAAAGEGFAGLDRMEARKAVVAKLEALGLLLKVENYVHRIGYSQRSHVPIEPYLSEQWFLRYPSVAEAMAAVESGQIKFHPERWSKTYLHWMANIKDWCISRQLWWGHRLPVWHKDGETRCQIESPGEGWTQDPDVLDTWFSSWLWPFATMGWPEKTETLQKFYPTTDLVTGPDIIFFWVARMIMAGLRVHGPGAVPPRLFHRHHPRQTGAQDVQEPGQLARPAGPHRQIRGRRAALRRHALGAAGPGHPV